MEQKNQWSGKLQAFGLLKTLGFINKPAEARYLGSHGANHCFGLFDGRLVSVDLVLGRVNVAGE